METVDKEKKIHHLAGIIPIGGQPLDFNMPWHDALMPIAKDYLAIERAVYQCALAGCETIWIVGHLGTQPLIRKRIGDLVKDPIYIEETFRQQAKEKYISIYYVPVNPKDRNLRDCLGWSALFGADSAYRISKFITKWIAPEKFFCCFPYGIVPDESLRSNRLLMETKQNLLFTHQGKSVKDNLHAPFTFMADDFFRCRDIVKHRLVDEWKKDIKPKRYDLATVFAGLDSTNAAMIDLPMFYDISSWDSYRNYIASQDCKLEKPNIFLTFRREKIGKDT